MFKVPIALHRKSFSEEKWESVLHHGPSRATTVRLRCKKLCHLENNSVACVIFTTASLPVLTRRRAGHTKKREKPAEMHITWLYTLGMVDSPVLLRLRWCGKAPESNVPSVTPRAASRSAGAAAPPPSPSAKSTFASIVKNPLFCGSM